MSKFVIGTDLSAESERAVAHGVAAARHMGAEVVLVMVDAVSELGALAVDAHGPPAARAAEVTHARRDELAALRQRWIDHGPELSQLVVDGEPAERLPQVAAELQADLIVVGSHGRTGVKRFLIGSVAERVVRHAACSVLVARRDAPDGGYRRVLVGTDLTPQLDTSVARVLPLLARGARIDLVHCWQAPWVGDPVAFAHQDELADVLAPALRDAATRVREMLRDRADVELVPSMFTAPPAHGLVDAAEASGADLVVVGSHGRRGLRRLLLGSVAEVTLRHARCSVLVAR